VCVCVRERERERERERTSFGVLAVVTRGTWNTGTDHVLRSCSFKLCQNHGTS
jgi:hypothetical protein